LGRHDPLITSEQQVLVLPRQGRGREPESAGQHALHLVRDLDAATRVVCAHGLQEVDGVLRPWVHQEKDRVQALGARRRRRAVEHGGALVHRHGAHLVGELGEQRAEPEQVRLAARRPLRAHHHVAPLQQRRHAAPVLVAAAGEAQQRDRREQLRQRAQAVRHGEHGLPQRARDGNRVEERAVVARVEPAARGAALAVRGGGRGAGDAHP
uniref:Uncharacterized protein n=1 Tax=Triticum urartu TaxID=4572 RepID=A0A8R7VHL5_TRIUA